MTYVPQPIDTSEIELNVKILAIREKLAENTHEVWSRGRVADGWRWGPVRDDLKKEHPCLIPYDDLPEKEKEFDRQTSLETLKVLMALGYKLLNDEEQNELTELLEKIGTVLQNA